VAVDNELLTEVVSDAETSAAQLRQAVTWLVLGVGGARRHGAPFGPAGWHGSGSVVASHDEQSRD
jgi:hypothetical protein